MSTTASCLVNTRAFHETELIIDEDMIPESDRLNIGVIGSGPAGLQFATMAERVGHRVTLYNRSKDIAGQFNMARRIPGKEEFNETIRYFCNEIKRLEMGGKLRVELGTNITYGDMERLSSSSLSKAGRCEGEGSEGMDWWIMSTGIPGLDHPNNMSYIDVLRRDTNIGDRVAIIGAGGIGFDAKIWIEDWGVDGTNKARLWGCCHRPLPKAERETAKTTKGGGVGTGSGVSS